jgi:protein-disulfide isomerase
VAKPDKKAGGKAASSAAPEPTKSSQPALWIVAACIAAAIIGGIVYSRMSQQAAPPTGDVAMSDLMMKGPLEDVVLGNADAPTTIVEYASMTCSHCANFHTNVFPELKTKYIDTGKAKFILREFPLDSLALAAFMVARCAGPDRYYPVTGALFDTQKTWAVPGAEGQDKLLAIARQAGFSKESFDKCLADKELQDKIVEVRTRANETFGVDSTPTFFIDGKRLRGGQNIKDFDTILAGGQVSETPHEDDGHGH